MIVNLGGSGGLDFHVVGGTTQPSNPKENTIWVNTSTDIPHYVVHYTAPTSETYKVNGAIWICDNALRWQSPDINIAKNKEKLYLPIFPTAVQQYENGAWVRKTAYVYKSGAWTELDRYLYNNGDDYTARTGGWITYNPASNTTNYTYGIGTCTAGDQYFRLKAVPVQGIARQTVNKIDLTSVGSIKVTIQQSGTFNWATFYVFVTSVSNSKQGVNDAATYKVNGLNGLSTKKRTVSLDVSSLTDSYYVCVGQQTIDGSAGVTTDVYSIELV